MAKAVHGQDALRSGTAMATEAIPVVLPMIKSCSL